MTEQPWVDLLPQVRAIVRAAAAAILPHYRAGGTVEHKADGSPVTAADRAAEAVIVPALQALTPAIPVVSEESVDPAVVAGLGTGPFWLVDPLDGTREFLKGLPEFTVNIGLVAGGVPVLGVIEVPVTGVQYFGVGGAGAGLAEPGGADRPMAARARPAAGLVGVVSRSFGDGAATERFLAAEGVTSVVRAGSSLKFCEVARGAADLYPRFGPTHEWDTAAGHAILAAAGGTVRRLDGGPLTYGKPGLLNPDFVAAGAAGPPP